MKKWTFAAIFFVGFLFAMSDVKADNLLFAFGGTYDEENQIIMLEISVKEAASLEAFTFAVEYDEAKYRLYEANDELPGGYGYDETFSSSYQSGTALSNALTGKVMFSGVNASQDIRAYKGVVARVAFLLYPGYETDLSDMRLRVSALHANGKNVELPNQGISLVCEKKEIQQRPGGTENSAIDTHSEEPLKTALSASMETTDKTFSNQTVQPFNQSILGQTDENNPSESINPVSPYSVQDIQDVEGDLKDHAAEEQGQLKASADSLNDKKTTNQNHKKEFMMIVLISIVIVVLGCTLKRTLFKEKIKKE